MYHNQRIVIIEIAECWSSPATNPNCFYIKTRRPGDNLKRTITASNVVIAKKAWKAVKICQ